MSYVAAHNAIRARFNAQWGSTTPIIWDNAIGVPPETAWVRFVVADGSASQITFGAATDLFRHLGMATIMIFSPANAGDGAALALADTALAVFRKWSDLTSGVKFLQSPYAQTVGLEGKWFHVNVLCPFQWDAFA